jgi:hypothetical protein
MSLFSKILVVLNILAAAGFAFIALLDHGKREAATAAVREFDIAQKGLPLQDQSNDSSVPRERYLEDQADRQDSEALKARFQAAGVPGKPVAVQVDEVKNLQKALVPAINGAAEAFVNEAKDKKKALNQVLLPLAANGEQLGDYRRRIEEAAGKGDAALGELLREAAKRRMLAQVLLPLEELRPRGRRDLLAITIGDLKDTPLSELEKLVESRFEEVLRPIAADEGKKDEKTTGMVFDLVTAKAAPFRVRYNRSPKDQKVTVVFLDPAGSETSVSGPVHIKLTNVEGQPRVELTKEGAGFSGTHEAFGKDQVLAGEITVAVSGKPEPERCLFVEREPFEQRQAIAYLLFTLSQVTRPDGKTPLLESLPEKRVEVIVGRQRFNHAIEMQTLLFRQIAERRQGWIEADRQTFIAQYQALLYERLPYLIAAIKRARASIKYWEDQLEKHDAQRRDRKKFRDLILARVQEERKKAIDALTELKKLQELYFKAVEAGAGVAEENQVLEKTIRSLEKGR